MNESPYDILDPASLVGLAIKRRAEVPLSPADLVPVLKANPEMIPNPDYFALVLAILNGEAGPKRGRPPCKPGRNAWLFLIDMEIVDRAEEIRAERKARPAGAKRVKSEKSPRETAADEIACSDFNITGRRLLENIATMKSLPFFQVA